ncbi:unnamed protein product [Linum tenue]|uniref:Uncharacterized protein n=1 Tax=Linum tenue TaxID=586396 RepID=A0AAV0PR41_9ROSI|nr:unnamed protein product [Linum tenue]
MGKLIIVWFPIPISGGASGIGLETARVMAQHKAHVIIGARNMEAASKAKHLILKHTPGARVDVLQLDLASTRSVRAFADSFKALNLPLNVLIYSDKRAYGQSKLANILHAKELSRRFQEEGVNITANAVHPGLIMTPLFRYSAISMSKQTRHNNDKPTKNVYRNKQNAESWVGWGL